MQIYVHGIEVEFRSSSLQHDACSKPSNPQLYEAKMKIVIIQTDLGIKKDFICESFEHAKPKKTYQI